MMSAKQVRVVCAVIVFGNRVLAVKRGPQMKMAGKWEFPGGKIEDGEDAHEAVIREILEELAMRIEVTATWPAVFHDYGAFQIELLPFLCTTPDEKPRLLEHESFLWLDQKTLFGPDWAEADLPVRDRAAQWLASI
jgi:8-oxo-dGTP diphosphatase